MTILITGASGLIGSHLCQKLAKNHDIVALARSANPLLESVAAENTSRIKIDSCDIRNTQEVEALVKQVKPTTIFHLAACCHPSHKPNDFVDTNIRGTSNVLNATKDAKVREFVFASSMSVYSEPPQYLPVDENHPTQPTKMYGRSKIIGEWLCNGYRDFVRVIILRYASVFGVGDRERVIRLFTDAALSEEPLLVQGDGGQSSDFIYVGDAVEGTILAWQNGTAGQVYNIGSGRETSIYDLARTIIASAMSGSVIKTVGESNRSFRFVSDITKAQRDLGYQPRALEDGLKRYVEELRDKR